MKELEPYSVFAEIYDYSMRFVPYKEWSGYILHRCNHFQKSKPNSILDIGCGTGELLHFFYKELKQQGSILIGLDQSQAMIQMAEEKSKKIQWIHSSIQDFESEVPFDLVVSTHTTINYFKNPADLFKYARKLTKKGGLFFFDFTSEINLLNHFHKKKIQESQQNLFLEWNSNFDPSTQEIQVNLDFYHTRTKAQIGREYHQQYFHKPANLEKDLKQNGFKILEKGGDYDLYSKYEASDMCHILCQKISG
jgi:ubiquinone/menaquinone biosynthesis C-methylase UbiE